ncbi:auxin-induced protein 22D [Dendrobium catenatum]|uniref:Auxin-responsive protein n=1 Tax=Dendrobium catenatum TaxID=906689 RepID=A0A2I0W922_9ASPA|nr:auxin-induced protein 22D [Dendrobium catenatum]PKU72152.1 Auxin-induced protein 22D [Dendrobium catenatum]
MIIDTENLRATELRLGLPGADEEAPDRPARGCKRLMTETGSEESGSRIEVLEDDRGPEATVSSKAQVVGWPPIRANRKNVFPGRKAEAEAAGGGGGIYVKVSMDGAPYLRKIDLKLYKSYELLREALEDMFKCFTSGDFSSVTLGGGGSNYAVAYEDKDGDWMLVGDVPWRMFISSCKRLRIMRGSDAKGLSPKFLN